MTPENLKTYGATFCEIGINNKKLYRRSLNNRCENPHLSFQRRERPI